MTMVTKEVISKWYPMNRNWYESKGYEFTKWKDEFIVKIDDMPPNALHKIDVKCDICGVDFIKGYNAYYKEFTKNGGLCRCKSCANRSIAKKQRLTIEYVRQQFEDRGYTLLSKEYINASHELEFVCPRHPNVVQKSSYHRLHSANGCIYCTSLSMGENNILAWLDSNNIIHAREYSFEDLIFNKGTKLRFDFAIFNKSNKLCHLIEYQGKQHFEPIEYFGGQEVFDKQVYNDNLKVNYCKDNNIPLLIIKYDEFSLLNDILTRELLVGDKP